MKKQIITIRRQQRLALIPRQCGVAICFLPAELFLLTLMAIAAVTLLNKPGNA